MTITQLQYVLAVAEHKNFTLAAEKCFVTQPTLSMQIQKIEEELKGLKKLYPQESFDITTRLKYQIIAINGDSNAEKIRLFVDNMLLQDSRAFRKYVSEITPDLDMVFNYEDSKGDIVEGVSVPMNLNFLWPDASL